MEAALRAAMLAGAGVAALVGDRIAWNLLPEGDQGSAIVLFKITGGVDQVQEGRVATATPLVQADLLSGSYAGVVALRDEVLAWLDAFNAASGPDDALQGIELVDDRDDPAEDADGPSADRSDLVFRKILELRPCFTPNS